MEQPRLEPVSIWKAGTVGCGFTLYATALAPEKSFSDRNVHCHPVECCQHSASLVFFYNPSSFFRVTYSPDHYVTLFVNVSGCIASTEGLIYFLLLKDIFI